jgi:predicted SAM-dependent methyltransferase
MSKQLTTLNPNGKDAYWHKYKDPDALLVNIGCGSKPFKGFTNVDSRTDLDIDFPGVDAQDLSIFHSETVDYIYACHILEHVDRNNTFNTLKEWNRVLNYGGMLRISVPDWDATLKYYKRTNDLENCLNWVYGGREKEVKNEFTHKRIFNLANLRSLLYEAGFKRIEVYDPFETFHSNIDDFSFACRPHMQFDTGIMMSLNVQAVK